MKYTEEKKLETVDRGMHHNGNLLKECIEKSGLTKLEIAQRMGITVPSLHNYYVRYSLQTKTLWNASQALNRNFMVELGCKLPVDFVLEREKEKEQEFMKKEQEFLNRIKQLESKIERLEMEVSVYEKILDKSKM